MKVVDLLDEKLYEACTALSRKIDCSIDLIIGIAEGGRFVAEVVAKKLDRPLLIVKKQRKLTKKKNNLKKLLPFFPKPILNGLRIVESLLYECFFNKAWKDQSNDVAFVSEDFSFLYNENVQTVLLIDDAIDSGSTIKDCLQFLLKQREDLQIKVAVITQTCKRPFYNPDYKMYTETLIRFPWSNDVR